MEEVGEKIILEVEEENYQEEDVASVPRMSLVEEIIKIQVN